VFIDEALAAAEDALEAADVALEAADVALDAAAVALVAALVAAVCASVLMESIASTSVTFVPVPEKKLVLAIMFSPHRLSLGA